MSTKIYYSMELGRITAGFDIAAETTIVRTWSLAVTGPEDLSVPGLQDSALKALEEVLRSSAEQAAYEAGMVAYAVPGEFATKLTFAWEVFWQRFPALVQVKAKGAAQQFIDKFSIGLVEAVVLVDGLVLQATAGKPMAAMYKQVYDIVSTQIGGDVGKVAGQYFGLLNQYNQFMTVDVSVKIPRDISRAAADVAKVTEAVEDLPQRLVDLSAAIEKEIKKDLATAETKVAEVALRAGQFTQSVANQIKRAGVHVEVTDEVLKRLLKGEPRLDFEATGDLKKRLDTAAQEIFTEISMAGRTHARAILDGLENLKRQIEFAISQCAVSTVRSLQREFEARTETYKTAERKLTELADKLNKGGLNNTAGEIAGITRELADEFSHISVFVQSAEGLVGEQIQKEANRIAEQALTDAQNAIDWARRRVDDFFGL